jgi:phosphate transport system protein
MYPLGPERLSTVPPETEALFLDFPATSYRATIATSLAGRRRFFSFPAPSICYWLLAISFERDSLKAMAQIGGKHFLPGFDQALESVKADVLLMANLVSRNLGNARAGFIKRDEDFCAAAIADDEEVDLLEKQVDQAGTEVLMRFQPMVVDLRTVLVTVKLASHLERISDYAVSIARRTRHLVQDAELEEAKSLDGLFDSIQKLFAEAIASFNTIDIARAGWVRGQVDALAEQARNLSDKFTDLIEERSFASRGYVGLMTIAESLEEITYLCGSIATEVIYIAEARDVRHPGNQLAAEEQ